jgi:hypothetical protein
MAKFNVYCTQYLNATIEVDAENEDQAMELAKEKLDGADWNHNDTTIDYAEPAEDGE